MRTDLSAEDELCLLLARGGLSPDLQSRARKLLASPLRWPVVMNRIRALETLPLVYRNLRELGFPNLPQTVRAELASTFWTHSLHNASLAEELVQLLRLLGGAGVPVIPLKGVALAESLYGDPALRACADTDVLVPPRHAREAFQLVVSAGYEPEFTNPHLLDLAVRYGKHGVLTRRDGAHTRYLELHYGLFWGGELERSLLEKIWSEAAPREFQGVFAFALSAEWEFLYLAVHAAQHGRTYRKWYVDLDQLCRCRTIDWKKVSQEAKTLGWEWAVHSSLAACRALFATPLDPVWGAIPPPGQLRLGNFSDLQMPSENLFLLRLHKTPARKLRYLAIRLLVPTPGECKLLPLPSSLFFLYYVLRPLRLACIVVGWLARVGANGLLRSLGLRKRPNRNRD